MPNVSPEFLAAFYTANSCAVSSRNFLRVIETMFELCTGTVTPDMQVSLERARSASNDADACALRVLGAIHRNDLEEANLASQDALADKQKASDAASHMFKRFTIITENYTEGKIRLTNENGLLAVWNGTTIEYSEPHMSNNTSPESL